MNFKHIIKSNSGFSTTILIIGFSCILAALLLISLLFSMYMNEIEAFYDDATVDCFLANRAAVVQLKIEYAKLGYVGEFDAGKCKSYLRDRLADTFNVINSGDDFLIATDTNRFVKYIEIKDYKLNESNQVECTIYITARPYFFLSFFKDPVYKIMSKVNIDKVNY
jgi:hypothetical protein